MMSERRAGGGSIACYLLTHGEQILVPHSDLTSITRI